MCVVLSRWAFACQTVIIVIRRHRTRPLPVRNAMVALASLKKQKPTEKKIKKERAANDWWCTGTTVLNRAKKPAEHANAKKG